MPAPDNFPWTFLFFAFILLSCTDGRDTNLHHLSARKETDKLQDHRSVRLDTCSYQVNSLKGKAWSKVKLAELQDYRKELLRSFTSEYGFGFEIYAHYVGNQWLASDSVYPFDSTYTWWEELRYTPLGAWQHPRTGDLWVFLEKNRWLLNTDSSVIVTSIRIIGRDDGKEFIAIPLVSALFLSPDSTRLLLAGENGSMGIGGFYQSYCFGTLEVIDVSAGAPRSLFVVGQGVKPGASESMSYRHIRGCWLEGQGSEECPACLRRVVGNNFLFGSVEQVWSTPESNEGLLLRIRLRDGISAEAKEIGVVYVLI